MRQARDDWALILIVMVAIVTDMGFRFQDSQHEGIVRLWFDSPERAARSPDGLWLTASSPLLTTVPPRRGQLSSGSGS
jgi:hypothetical protein